MTTNVNNLPPHGEISDEQIARAAAAFGAAKVAANEAHRTHVQLEQELPQAHDQDAAADAQARDAGKPPLKGRPATKRAEEAIVRAEHEELVSVKLLEKARDHLRAALDEHGEAWKAEVLGVVEGLDKQWSDAISALIQLHGQRKHARQIARQIGCEALGVAAIQLDRTQLAGIELAVGSVRTADIDVGDILAAMADLGKPADPKIGVTRGGIDGRPGQRIPSPNESDGAVVDEINERKAFLALSEAAA